MSLFESINSHERLCGLSAGELPGLCAQIREYLIKTISRTGGHLASNLGVVELTVALHRVYDAKRDRIVFDVGHQCYTHKLLTGRADGFSALRQYGGLSGFSRPRESDTDAFIAGHASTSVSTALGMARARTLSGESYDVVAVIGDGALTGGVAYEGLCCAGQSKEPMVVILNDNAMSINCSVGGMAKLLSRLRVRPAYFEFKRVYHKTVGRVKPLYNTLHAIKEGVKDAILPDNMFDDMGFYYLGPVNGHDLDELESAIRWARDMRVPVLLHVMTKKGKGCSFAEKEPDKYHGVGPFDPVTGEIYRCPYTFSDAFGDKLTELALSDPGIVAITAAMSDGTGLSRFAAEFPRRFFDVSITEENAVVMAAGMAKQGLTPVVAVYSTFLQRAYDMLIHDVALLGLHVVFAVDRAGLVGGDGETHNGLFDAAYLSSVPGMELWCPASFAELGQMLKYAVSECTGPVAVRYPRGTEGKYISCDTGVCSVMREGSDITLAAYGTMINCALDAADILLEAGISAEVIKLGRIVPLDASPVLESIRKTGALIVPEEVCAAGCVGERILAAASGRLQFVSRLINLGDGIIAQGDNARLYAQYGLDGAGIAGGARELLRGAKGADEA